MTTAGYHTLEDRDNVDEIETDGPQKCKRKDAWLGDGYYFWDTEIEWAHDWGKQYSEYMIFEGTIEINEVTFDLVGNVSHKIFFRKIYEELKDKGYFAKGMKVNVPNLLEYLKKHTKFLEKYNSIRSEHPTKSELTITYGGKLNEYLSLGDTVQICLITKKNLISQSFKVVYPQKYVA